MWESWGIWLKAQTLLQPHKTTWISLDSRASEGTAIADWFKIHFIRLSGFGSDLPLILKLAPSSRSEFGHSDLLKGICLMKPNVHQRQCLKDTSFVWLRVVLVAFFYGNVSNFKQSFCLKLSSVTVCIPADYKPLSDLWIEFMLKVSSILYTAGFFVKVHSVVFVYAGLSLKNRLASRTLIFVLFGSAMKLTTVPSSSSI